MNYIIDRLHDAPPKYKALYLVTILTLVEGYTRAHSLCILSYAVRKLCCSQFIVWLTSLSL